MEARALDPDVLLAAGGTRDAFGRLIDPTRGMVCSLKLSLVLDVETSEDVAQDSYLAAWQSIGRLAQPSQLPAVAPADHAQPRDALSEIHPQADRRLTVRSFADALMLAAFGIGVAIVPASYHRLVVGGLFFRKNTERLPQSEVVMAWRDGSVPEELLNGLRALGDGRSL